MLQTLFYRCQRNTISTSGLSSKFTRPRTNGLSKNVIHTIPLITSQHLDPDSQFVNLDKPVFSSYLQPKIKLLN